jgi:hypothetical protein
LAQFFTLNDERFIMPLENMTPETALFGGAGTVAGGIWLWSKLRIMLVKDSGDSSAYITMKSTLESLRDENTRLHGEVMRLQTEITRLQGVVTSLLGQLNEVNALLKQNNFLDQMAREGKVDRRKRSDNGESQFAASWTKPEPLPNLGGA